MSKAFRCDKCGNLIEDKGQAAYPGIAAGYINGYHVRIEVGKADFRGDACESCVRKVAAEFLAEPPRD